MTVTLLRRSKRGGIRSTVEQEQEEEFGMARHHATFKG